MLTDLLITYRTLHSPTLCGPDGQQQYVAATEATAYHDGRPLRAVVLGVGDEARRSCVQAIWDKLAAG